MKKTVATTLISLILLYLVCLFAYASFNYYVKISKADQTVFYTK